MKQNDGFTLVELMVAFVIAIGVIGMAIIALVQQFEVWNEDSVENELSIDLQLSMELLRKDLRLSSVGTSVMAFYPASASEYTAISFPLANDDNGDSLFEMDENGIIWDETVIYHIRATTPNEFVRTVFSPRNTNASPAELYAQLELVAASTNWAGLTNACMAGESVTSRTLFENLVDLKIRPSDVVYDGYSSVNEKNDTTINFGSLILSNGTHNLTFTVIGKNTNSTGYKIGIDAFRLSASGSKREGELFYPVRTRPGGPHFRYSISGGSVSANNMSGYGATWSGNSQLTYSGTAPGDSITLLVRNDLWTDANFTSPNPSLKSNTTTVTDSAYWPADIVAKMDSGVAWSASAAADVGGTFSFTNPAASLDIFNIIYGDTYPTASAIVRSGYGVRVKFEAGSAAGYAILACNIATNNGSGPPLGTTQLFFDGGDPSYKLSAGESIWTDWERDFAIDKSTNYLVYASVRHHGSGGVATIPIWTRTSDSIDMSFTNYNGGGYQKSDSIFGITQIETGYPDQGILRSAIIDTGVDDPVYNALYWTDQEYGSGPDGDVDVRIRAGDQPDLSDSSGWVPGGYFQSGTSNSLAAMQQGRYFQYEALFTCRDDHDVSAKLRDVTVDWATQPGVVDLQVDFSRGPDYGTVAATVNGQSCSKGIEIEMEIYQDTRYRKKTVAGIMEVRPLNTGK